MGPPLIVNVAKSYEGLVERVDVRGGVARGVPLTTVALHLVCMLGWRMFLNVRVVVVGLRALDKVVAMVVGNVAVFVVAKKASQPQFTEAFHKWSEM